MKKRQAISPSMTRRLLPSLDFRAATLCMAVAVIIFSACGQDQHRWADHLLIDEAVKLREDEWKVWPREQAEDGLVRVEYRLISGPSIDVLFMDENNTNIYESILKGDRACEPVRRNDQLSFSPLARSHTSDWVWLPKGRYYIVAENHDCGTGPPWDGIDNPAEVHVKLFGKKRPVSKWPKWLGSGA